MTATKIKICGLKNPEDAVFAALAGADFIGLVFCHQSPRYITIAQAQAIIAALKNTPAQAVAVFRDQNIKTITSILQATGLSMAQLHGQECINAHEKLNASITRILSIAADSNGGISLPDEQLNTLDPARDYLLIDNLNAGSGETLNLKPISLNKQPLRAFLAGGLKPDNIKNKIREHQPYAVDVSSGVESSRGIKSQPLIKTFIQNARNPS
jgi:phosphoribosylanthranilate isomerase